MWAHGAAEIERQFHFSERLLQIGGGNGANHSVAFVTHNIGLISANEAVQTTATIWISERRMRKGGPYNTLRIHVLSVAFHARSVI